MDGRHRPAPVRSPGFRGVSGAALLFALACLPWPGAATAQTQIARTVHNLTPSGPGRMRVGEEAGLCVFCHTPHNARPTRALWNMELPAVTYKLYQSSTLEAKLNQPTGFSRLCLSCHDGTLALGMLRVRPKGSRFSLGALSGRTSLGTDLSDDHPVSFVYDSALAVRRGQLADPSALPSALRLDETGQLQCSTCHDAHEDRNPKFLRMDDRSGALCTACHRLRNWTSSSHATSTATWTGSGTSPWPPGAPSTVRENACGSCHRSHAAGRPQRLLAQSDEVANCTVCHGGTVASRNVEGELVKPFRHPQQASQWVHDPKEDPALMSRHVTCVDCHNPHAATSATASPPTASGRIRGIQGVSMSGGRVQEAGLEYEVCLKCHGLQEPTALGILRQDTTRNIRLKINTANPSYHPVAAPGKHHSITGLEPTYTPSSLVSCTDCHNNDEWTPTGLRPCGSHGSRYEPILEREYRAEDPSSESFASYALCYKCHNRTSLLFGTGLFPHRLHVVDQRASCAVCHDAHGARRNPRLINFMLRAKAGNTVVTASSGGLLEFTARPAPGRGSCFLRCHGADHNPKNY